MEVMFTPEISLAPKKKHTGTVALNKMVSRLLYAFQPAAVQHNSFFVNEVPVNFTVNADRNMLAAVISGLLNSVAGKTKNSCIHLGAKRYSNIILFRLQNLNADGNGHFEYNWREINPLVEKLGGCITIGEANRRSSSITFSFRSLADAI